MFVLYCDDRLDTYDLGSIFGYIYKIILPDGRYYIGQKRGIPGKSRNYYGSGTHINNWFIKNIGYSSRNCPFELAENHCVEKEILDVALDQIELDSEEIMWIKCYREKQEYKGQCLNLNGGGSVSYTSTEERKKKYVEKMKKYYDDPNGYWKNHKEQIYKVLQKAHESRKGCHHTEEEKKHLSEVLKGRKKSAKTVERMKLAQKGSKNPSAKLNEDKVREIRMYLKNKNPKDFNKKEIKTLLEPLAKKYDVSIQTISLIWKGKTWKHVII